MKTCSKCNVPKEDEEFPIRLDRPGKRQSRCKCCLATGNYAANKKYRLENRETILLNARQRYLLDPKKAKEKRAAYRLKKGLFFSRRKYGSTLSEITALFDSQKGLCAICKQPPTKIGLCLDHDHNTGKARGFLCLHCNSALGYLKDSAASARSAAEYLDRTTPLTN